MSKPKFTRSFKSLEDLEVSLLEKRLNQSGGDVHDWFKVRNHKKEKEVIERIKTPIINAIIPTNWPTNCPLDQ